MGKTKAPSSRSSSAAKQKTIKGKPAKDKKAVKNDPNNNQARRAEKTEWKNFQKHGLGTMSDAELKAYQKMSIAMKATVRKASV